MFGSQIVRKCRRNQEMVANAAEGSWRQVVPPPRPVFARGVVIAAALAFVMALSWQPTWADDAPPTSIGHLGGQAHTVSIVNHFAFVGFDSEFAVIDVSRPEQPTRIAYLLLPGAIEKIVTEDSFAYVGWTDVRQNGGCQDRSRLQVIDISDAAAPRTLGAYESTGRINDVAVQNGYAYVTYESCADPAIAGMQIVDISDPNHPVGLGTYSHWARRVAVDGHYAYIAAGNSGLRIVDISSPTQPVEVGVYQETGLHHTFNAGDVAVAGHFAYVTNGYYNLLHVIDVLDPTRPKLEKTVGALSSWPGRITLAGHHAYIASGDVYQFDIASPMTPILDITYPTPGQAAEVAVAGGYLYIADQSSGLRIYEFSTSLPVSEVGVYAPPAEVRQVAIDGDHAYVSDASRLWVIDITDPIMPASQGSLNLSPVDGLVAEGGYIYVANNGLSIVDATEPLSPTLITHMGLAGGASSVAITGTYAYVLSYNFGLWIVDVSDPAYPRLVGSFSGISQAMGLALQGTCVYIVGRGGGQGGGLWIVDVANPASPRNVGYVSLGIPTGLAVVDQLAYITDMQRGFTIIDVGDPARPVVIGQAKAVKSESQTSQIAIIGSYAYLSDAAKGVVAVDVGNPKAPYAAGNYDPHGTVTSVTAAHDLIYAGSAGDKAAGNGLWILPPAAVIAPPLQNHAFLPLIIK